MINNNSMGPLGQSAFMNKKRRAWSIEEKLNMLEEAEQHSNFSQVAKKYDISPSQLFAWRKLRIKGHLQEEKSLFNYFDLQKEIISANDKAACLEEGLLKLADEIKKGKLSLYQGACAYGALVSAACKIAHLKFEIWDRVIPYTKQDNISTKEPNNPLEDEMRRESANILVKILERRKRQQNQNKSER